MGQSKVSYHVPSSRRPGSSGKRNAGSGATIYSTEKRPASLPRGEESLHWSFEDPSQAAGTEKERSKLFRRVRDEIRERIEGELVPK
jgi:protein-tyrosine-phosphatase